jgi:hypothetical protein
MITLTRDRAAEVMQRLARGDTYAEICDELEIGRTTIARIRYGRVTQFAEDRTRTVEVVIVNGSGPRACGSCGRGTKYITRDGQCLKCVAAAMGAN